MAYTFNDHYRAARLLLRVNAVTIGLGLGALLLVYPRDLLELAGITLGSAWAGPHRRQRADWPGDRAPFRSSPVRVATGRPAGGR